MIKDYKLSGVCDKRTLARISLANPATWSFETISHTLRIATRASAGENHDRLADDTIPNEIRESTNDRAANVAMYDLINERCFGKSINDA